MRIAIFEASGQDARAFQALAPRNAVEIVAQPLVAGNVSRHAESEIISTFMASRLDKTTLEHLTALRLIATRSTGFDHIDLAYCRGRGIAVCNVPAYGDVTVAEHAFALLLAISHRIVTAVAQAKTRFSPEGLQGFDLSGKTFGVIGTGSIGRCAVRIARGFGMDVIAYDIAPEERLAHELGFAYGTMQQVLQRADIISLHVPANEATRNLISQAAFEQMKPGVILINTARGSVIDSRALIGALRSGKVAWAGLDVLPAEPLLRQGAAPGSEADSDLAAAHRLLRMPNVLVTPHSGFNTREALERIRQTSLANIESFLAGRPANIVS